jgi:hypothetical protein
MALARPCPTTLGPFCPNQGPMLLDTIQTELRRLQLHPVNLDVAAKDDRLVALRGSLLQYWKVPAIVDGKWLLGILQVLPDAAGAQAVMSAVTTAPAAESAPPEASESPIALKLFNPRKK